MSRFILFGPEGVGAFLALVFQLLPYHVLERDPAGILPAHSLDLKLTHAPGMFGEQLAGAFVLADVVGGCYRVPYQASINSRWIRENDLGWCLYLWSGQRHWSRATDRILTDQPALRAFSRARV